jgi:hypothetical protein
VGAIQKAWRAARVPVPTFGLLATRILSASSRPAHRAP